MRVPALPGSDMPTGTANNRGPAASTDCRDVSGSAQTATSPTGVTVSDNAFAAFSVITETGAPFSSAPNRSSAASVAKTSETAPRRSAASTRLGPSTRKRAA
jgi:hypothetical protein